MRKVYKTVSVSLAVIAVVYGLFLKFIDKTPVMAIEPVVIPLIVASSDSVQHIQVELSSEGPN